MLQNNTEEGVEQSRHVLSLYTKKPTQVDPEPFVKSIVSFGGKIIAMECLAIDEGQL